MRILVTDGALKHTLAIVRRLGQLGFRPYVTATARDCLAAASRFCAGWIRVPRYSDPNFVPVFLGALDDNRIDLVIPVGTAAFRSLVPIRGHILHKAEMITVDEHKLRQCLSKARTYKLANEVGVPFPKTIEPGSKLELYDVVRRGEVSYPCVIKAKEEMGINVVEYAHAPEELLAKYEAVCRRFRFRTADSLPLVQEYIKGFGCGFFAVYNRGHCGPTFQHKRLREFPPSGGYSVAARAFRDDRCLEYGKRLLDRLQWHGVAMVEFRMSDAGPVLMEINPKFWGSLDLALEAGVDFPLALVRIARGENLEYSEEYNDQQRYHWPLHGEFAHLLYRPQSALAVACDLLNFRTRSNLWLRRDPRPLPRMLARTALQCSDIVGNAIKVRFTRAWRHSVRFR